MLSYNTEIQGNSFNDRKNSIICASCHIILSNKIIKSDWNDVITFVTKKFKPTLYPITVSDLKNEFKKNNNTKNDTNFFANNFNSIKQISYEKIYYNAIDWIVHINQFSVKMNTYINKSKQMKAILAISAFNIYECLQDCDEKNNIKPQNITNVIEIALVKFNKNLNYLKKLKY